METECRLPLLRQRAPGLPPVPVKFDGAFGGLAKRGDAAPHGNVGRITFRHPQREDGDDRRAYDASNPRLRASKNPS